MKTEPSTSSTTPPVLPKRGEPEINPPPSVRGNLAWGVHWPWHKALAVANRIWWYNPLRHTTTEKYTSENTDRYNLVTIMSVKIFDKNENMAWYMYSTNVARYFYGPILYICVAFYNNVRNLSSSVLRNIRTTCFGRHRFSRTNKPRRYSVT